VARQAISSDPNFHDGFYQDHGVTPKQGLRLARMVGHITYLSEDGMGEKFGRDLKTGSFTLGSNEEIEFQIESYLRHQGDVFSTSFDANTYILMTKALDFFDLAREYGDDPVSAFQNANCSFLVISFTTDWRFAPERSREIVDALIAAKKAVSYAEIKANFGHDAFLIPNERYQNVFHAYMQRVAREIFKENSNAV
jgi:homoserine O-acetyltransferase